MPDIPDLSPYPHLQVETARFVEKLLDVENAVLDEIYVDMQPADNADYRLRPAFRVTGRGNVEEAEVIALGAFEHWGNIDPFENLPRAVSVLGQTEQAREAGKVIFAGAFQEDGQPVPTPTAVGVYYRTGDVFPPEGILEQSIYNEIAGRRTPFTRAEVDCLTVTASFSPVITADQSSDFGIRMAERGHDGVMSPEDTEAVFDLLDLGSDTNFARAVNRAEIYDPEMAEAAQVTRGLMQIISGGERAYDASYLEVIEELLGGEIHTLPFSPTDLLDAVATTVKENPRYQFQVLPDSAFRDYFK